MLAIACALVIDSSTPETPFSGRGDACAFDVAMTIGEARLFGGTVGVTAAEPRETPIDALTAEAERALDGTLDGSVVRQGREILAKVRTALKAFNLAGIPALRGTAHDDGSFTFEWRFPDRRLAFTIERDPAESGWHLVSSRSSGDVRAYGALSDDDLRPLLGWALRRTPSA
jgi:hypothetical protein